jgi:precorrin-6B methylase 1
LGLLFLLSFVQEKLYGKLITLADREMVEEKADEILSEARGFDVAFLVVGDPFGYGLSSLFLFDCILWNDAVG